MHRIARTLVRDSREIMISVIYKLSRDKRENVHRQFIKYNAYIYIYTHSVREMSLVTKRLGSRGDTRQTR